MPARRFVGRHFHSYFNTHTRHTSNYQQIAFEKKKWYQYIFELGELGVMIFPTAFQGGFDTHQT
jgi:hypothetical protein